MNLKTTFMKTKLILSAALCALTAACSNQYNCIIEGKVEGAADNDTLFIARLVDGEFTPADTICIVNGTFSFNEQMPADSVVVAAYYYVNREKEIAYNNYFFIEEGSIFLNVSEEPKRSGTVNNDLCQKLDDSIAFIMRQKDEIYVMLDTLQTDSVSLESLDAYIQAQDSLEQLNIKFENALRAFVTDNISQAAGTFIFLNAIQMFEPQEILELCNNMYPNWRDNPAILELKGQVEKVLRTSDGQQITLPKMPTLKGDSLDIQAVIKANKLTLIDCWASWCDPCREEMPNVKELYKNYHKKGLEIIGISFDDNKEAWQKAIKEMELNWQHVSELKAWDNIMSLEYGVRYIPFTILVDSTGTIIATRLTGDDLAAAIADQLD